MGSWNVNGKLPKESIDAWIIDSIPKDEKRPDIVALGFQELDLSAGALILGDNSRVAPWEEKIASTLKKIGNYTMIMSKQLVGVLLNVWVEEEHLAFIKEVHSETAAVGIMGMMVKKNGKLRNQTIKMKTKKSNSH